MIYFPLPIGWFFGQPHLTPSHIAFWTRPASRARCDDDFFKILESRMSNHQNKKETAPRTKTDNQNKEIKPSKQNKPYKSSATLWQKNCLLQGTLIIGRPAFGDCSKVPAWKCHQKCEQHIFQSTTMRPLDLITTFYKTPIFMALAWNIKKNAGLFKHTSSFFLFCQRFFSFRSIR